MKKKETKCKTKKIVITESNDHCNYKIRIQGNSKRLTYENQIIETSDNKLWIYDDKHHEWINVTPPKKLIGVKL